MLLVVLSGKYDLIEIDEVFIPLSLALLAAHQNHLSGVKRPRSVSGDPLLLSSIRLRYAKNRGVTDGTQTRVLL